ncbi:DUF4073 domain-containing protein [Sporosarcina sp. FSL K6-3457]|uniref:DUF4073 domain-containing protein n=1 Tax=Sporosarcina sp. FSL K6-3457 TaxID=2978204 RepID=UPI0030F823BF
MKNRKWIKVMSMFLVVLLISNGLQLGLVGKGYAIEDDGIAGDGMEANPFIITTPEQLDKVRDNLTAHYKLGNDIDLNVSPYNTGEGWEPIGSDSDQFGGSFDGNGKIISNLFINRPDEENMGLFGYVSGQVKNLGLQNANITGNLKVGALVGTNMGGNISKTSASGVVEGSLFVGGLVGYSTGTIDKSHATSNVSGQQQSVGGLVGQNNGSISESYAAGNVSVLPSTSFVGGLVGLGHGLVDNVTSSYWDNETTGQTTSFASDDLFGKTTTEMMQQATFVDWDFGGTWEINEGTSYPTLKFQDSTGGADTVAPVLTAGTAERTSDATATVKFTSNEAGEYYYSVIAVGEPVPTLDTNGIGVATTTEETIISLIGLASGVQDIYIQVKDAAGNISIALKIEIPIYSGMAGEGTEANPYIVTTPEQLNQVRDNLTAHYKLENNIDLSMYGADYDEGKGWIPIATFTGSFDGNGKTISNLFIDRLADDSIGLFGRVQGQGNISNVGLVGIDIKGKQNVGGLVGFNSGTISRSYVTGSVIGRNYTGGLVGFNYGGSEVIKSYSQATVDGTTEIGGLVGVNSGSINESYSTGKVTSANGVGGLVSFSPGSATSSYWDTEATGQTTSAGSDASFGKTTVEMKQQSTFAGWDFDDTWKINEGVGYPAFIWQEDDGGSDTVAPVLTAGTVERTSDATATVKFTSNEAGEYYYSVIAVGEPVPTLDTNGIGVATTTEETTISLSDLVLGAQDIYIQVKDTAGNVSTALKIEIPAPANEEGTISWDIYSGGAAGLAGKLTPSLQLKSSEQGIPTTMQSYSDSHVESGISYTVKSSGSSDIRRWWYNLFFVPNPQPANLADKLIIELSGNVYYFGAKFTGTNSGGLLQNGTTVNVTVTDKQGNSKIFTHSDQGENYYLIQSEFPISKIEVDAENQYSTSGEIVIGSFYDEIPPNYTISPSTNNPIEGTVTGGGTYLEGVETMVKATPNNGYEFENWTVEGVTISDNPEYILKADKNYNLIANFKPKDYSITYHLNGGTNDNSNPTSYTITTETITLGEPRRVGYSFVGWLEQDATGQTVTQIEKGSTGDKLLWAKWLLNSIPAPNVTTDDALNIIIGINSTMEYQIDDGEWTAYDASSPPDLSGDKTVKVRVRAESGTGMPAGSITTLQFSTNISLMVVVFDTQGGSEVGNRTVNYNTTIVAPTPPTRTGYIFAGWYKEVGLMNEWDFSIDQVTSGTTLYAKWTVQKYTVDFNVDGGSIVSSQNIEHGQQAIQPTVPTKTGYTFAGWYTDATFGTAFDFVTTPISGATTVYAKWAIQKHAVDFNVDGGSKVSSQNIEHGQKATQPTAPTKTGYTFAGWYTDATFETTFDFVATPISEATTVYTKWTITSYTVTFDSQGGHAIGSTTANYNTTITAPTSPTRAGYTFGGWYKEVGLTNAWNFTTNSVIGDTTLYAKWTVNEPIPPSTESTVPSSPTPTQPTVEEINVDVEIGTAITKTPVKRTTEPDGTVKDQVTFTTEKVNEAIEKLRELQQDTARIIIPDNEDKVSEVNVTVPRESVDALANEKANLEIYTENVQIRIPYTSMQDFGEDLYFRVVPLKEQTQKNEVEERAKQEESVQKIANGKTIQVLGRPMVIETNMENRPVTLTIPLPDALPTDEKERQHLLDNLVVYIEHDDGTKEVIQGKLVTYKDGKQGIEFGIDKFSTFTLIYVEGLVDYSEEQDVNSHSAYIQGYPDKTFKLNAPVTRSQMATMLARNSGYTEEADETDWYNDVPKTHGAYNAILTVKKIGVMVGDGNSFNPSGNITRAQMARIVYRWVQNACENDSNAYEKCANLSSIDGVSYTDVSSENSAAQAILAIRKFEIMEGYGDGTFRPGEKLTRAQAVKVLNRLYKRGPLYGDFEPSFTDVPTSHWAFREIEEAARNHVYTISTDGKENFVEE